MINKENKLDRIIHIATDITEHKQAQEKLKQQQLNLENLVEELESFSFSIAHDLRTPLWTIEGFADILRNEFKEIDDGQRSNYIERIYLASHHMSQLIADTLEMIRISKIELKKERIDLSRLTGKVFTQLKENYPERRISMSIAPDLEVWGDAKLLELAIRNLISNALKFTGKNPQAVIELEKLQKEGQEIYFLADNGVGFDIRYAEKIFRAFERLHPDAEFEGTGVGLAIVQSIIKKHGGQVWAEGKIDRGATFYFTLD